MRSSPSTVRTNSGRCNSGPNSPNTFFLGDFEPETASDASNPQVRWRPEEHEGLDDVRRIKVRYADERPDLDLFEFYWAPKMAGNRLIHFQAWFFDLLRRPMKDLPRRVRWVKPVVIAWVWTVFLTMLFYLYLTAGALSPVQLVQIVTHGFGDFLQFALDMRLAVFSIPFIMTGTAGISLLRRRYGRDDLCLLANAHPRISGRYHGRLSALSEQPSRQYPCAT